MTGLYTEDSGYNHQSNSELRDLGLSLRTKSLKRMYFCTVFIKCLVILKNYKQQTVYSDSATVTYESLMSTVLQFLIA